MAYISFPVRVFLVVLAGLNIGLAQEKASQKRLKLVTTGEATALKYPEQVVLITSVGTNGQMNVMTAGWFMFCSGNPEMLAVAIGKKSHTHSLITQTKQFVVGFPGKELEKEIMICGTKSGRDTDKFKESGLTPAKGSVVQAPLVEQCLANFECEVVHEYDSGSHTIFVGKIVATWAAEDTKGRPRLFNLGKRSFRGLP